MTDLTDLPLSAAVRDHYRARGVETLYPPQEDAVAAGLLAGGDVVAAVPTASGKTLIAELAMLTTEGLSLYVVPLRALAHEKAATFAGLPDTEVVVTTGDVTGDVTGVGDADIVVATSEKLNAVLRTGPAWLDRVSCLVVDEFHLLDDPNRGPTLEMTVATLRHHQRSLQTVALSATVGNADELADWLGATLVDVQWRPVELRRGIATDKRIRFEDGSTQDVAHSSEEGLTHGLVKDTLADGGQCLVFVHSRRAAEEFAATLTGTAVPEGGAVADEIRERARTSTGRDLASVVADGVAFHHAGLRDTHRTLVEDAFRDGKINVVVATPTLAAGVNLPARRVVVRDHERYTGDGWTPLPVLDVHQMFGRAGRPGLDPHGEAILVADHAEEIVELRHRYLEGTPEPVESALATQDALRTHVLGTVAGGFAPARENLIEVLAETFYAFQAGQGTLIDVADLVIDDLRNNALLAAGPGLEVTAFGRTVAEQFIDPHTGVAFRDALPVFEELGAVTRRTVLELACHAGDVEGFYVRSEEHGDMHLFARRHANEFVTDPTALEERYADWLRTIKTVRALAEYLDGASEDAVTDAYGIGPGDLRLTTEQVAWLVGALAAVADLDDAAASEQIKAVRTGLEDRLDS